MSRGIEFHDGYLVGHHVGTEGSLHLQIQLDPVWNGGSDRIVRIGLFGIANVPEVREYFSGIERAERHSQLVQQGAASRDPAAFYEPTPTVLNLEFLEEDGALLVSLELLFHGGLDVVCGEIESDERSSLRFVR